MDSNSKEFYQAVGGRIRSLRKKKRYTVAELAEMVGISLKYWYQIESGKVCFSSEILYKISRSLEVTTDFLLSGKCVIVENSVISTLGSSDFVEDKDLSLNTP